MGYHADSDGFAIVNTSDHLRRSCTGTFDLAGLIYVPVVVLLYFPVCTGHKHILALARLRCYTGFGVGSMHTLSCFQVVMHLLESACPRNTVNVSLSLLFWLDGTPSGQRTVSVAKVRLVDSTNSVFPLGFSPIGDWMESFFSETHIPLEHKQFLLEQLGTLWKQTFTANDFSVRVTKIVLLADHKQLNSLCGVQGGQTSQRCSICTLPASLFCIDAFGGQMRNHQQTARDAMDCAREVVLNRKDTASIRRKYHNVSDVPFLLLGECEFPLARFFFVPTDDAQFAPHSF